MAQPRHPGGTPAGGRYAAVGHAESDVVLGDLDGAWDQIHEELDGWEADAARIANEQADLEERGRDLHRRFSDIAGQRIAAGLSTSKPSGPAPGAVVPVPADADDGVVDGRDQRVLDGQVFDAVRVYDAEFEDSTGTVFHRRRDGVFPHWPYAMRFQADRPLTGEEIAHCAQLIGYAYRAEVRGEPIGHPQRDTPFSFTVYADTTKTRSDDLGMALERFETTLPGLLRDGSPVRTTDRSGPGTKGTRLVEGFGDGVPVFELYYDDVVDESSSAAA